MFSAGDMDELYCKNTQCSSRVTLKQYRTHGFCEQHRVSMYPLTAATQIEELERTYRATTYNGLRRYYA
jgi:hypothetical protein